VLVLINRYSDSRRLAVLDAGANDGASREAPIQEIADRVSALVATATTAEDPPRAPTPAGAHTITVLGARGGSGKTMLATNLAAALAQERGETAVLLDLNLEFGTSAYMLNLRPQAPLNEIADAAAAGASDAEFDAMLLRHPSGLRLLAAPVQPGDSELISVASLSAVIRRLRTLYDHVIIDARPSFRDFMLDLWENSDALIVPCPPEVISVLLTRALLDAFEIIGIDQGKTIVVLNQVGSRPRLSQAQAEKGLRRAVQLLPHGGDLLQHSVDAGKPIVLEGGDHPTAVGLRQLTKQLLERRNTRRAGVAVAG
jgi:pilus assembly protein CpaE